MPVHYRKAMMEFSILYYVLISIGVTVYADSCYKTVGSYVYSSYCSGYCSGSYGDETCIYSYTYTYYYTYYYYLSDTLSTGAIVGIVIGCLIALAIVIGIIVAIVKGVSRSTGIHGTVVQTSGNTGLPNTVSYSVTAATTGPSNCNDGTGIYSAQQRGYPHVSGSYPPVSSSYLPNKGYPPIQNSAQPPPYNSEYAGVTPVDPRKSYI